MDAETMAFLAFGMAVLAFLWNLRKDIGDLRVRVSRVEGMLAGAGLTISPDSASG